MSIKVTVVLEWEPRLEDYDNATNENEAMEEEKAQFENGELDVEDILEIAETTTVSWEVV